MKEKFTEVTAKSTNPKPPGEKGKKPLSKRQKKNIRNGIIAVVCVLVLVIGSILLNGGKSAAPAVSYQIVELTKGDLFQSVTGSGALSLPDSHELTLPTGIKINELVAKSGAKLAEGDTIATLDAETLNQVIAQLQESVNTGNSELSQYNNSTATSYISSNITGRVKIIDLKVDDVIQSVMDEKGALMVLSVDGYMKLTVSVESAGDLALNQEVTVTLPDGMKRTGTVSAIETDGKAFTVLLGDYYPVPGEEATVSDGDKELGKGTLEINQPQYITGNTGTCKSIPVSLNQKVYNGTTLIRLKNLPISNAYETKLGEVKDLVEQLNTAISYRSSGNLIPSPYEGILAETELTSGSTIGEELNTLTVNDTSNFLLDVSVDELDILDIKEGMPATITVDALEEESFEGEVTFISASGTSENGVTKYPVTLKVTTDGRLLPGMSASADIIIEERKDVLLVPLLAVNTMRGKSFVYKYDGTAPESAEMIPGVMTEIETGLSNDSSVEVVSGLSESDRIVVVREGQSDTGFMFGGMGGMGGMRAVQGETVVVAPDGGPVEVRGARPSGGAQGGPPNMGNRGGGQ